MGIQSNRIRVVRGVSWRCRSPILSSERVHTMVEKRAIRSIRCFRPIIGYRKVPNERRTRQKNSLCADKSEWWKGWCVMARCPLKPIGLTRSMSVFPPPDSAAAEFVCAIKSDERQCEIRMHAFLYGLFVVTRERLVELAQGYVAFDTGTSCAPSRVSPDHRLKGQMLTRMCA